MELEKYVLSKLWEMKKDEILSIGKELIRLITTVAKIDIPEITHIIEELSKISSSDK